MTEDRARLDDLPAHYPRLFSKPLPSGLELGAGWTVLVEALLSRIDTLLENSPAASFEILQIKEKFGTLRFYYRIDNAPDAVVVAIRQATSATEAASAFCCEICGARGRLGSDKGWMRVRCPACADP